MNTYLLKLMTLIVIAASLFDASFARSNHQSEADRDRAVAIAKEDASKVYRSLEPYEILVSESSKRWFVKFKLKDKTLNGGGPEYVISKKTGKIIKKRYWQ